MAVSRHHVRTYTATRCGKTVKISGHDRRTHDHPHTCPRCGYDLRLPDDVGRVTYCGVDMLDPDEG